MHSASRASRSPRRHACVAAAALLLAACGGGFRYEKLSTEALEATREVAWLTAAPERPYQVLARFRGAETALCPASRPYCSLYAQAMQQGADAIWVQRRDEWTRPQQWLLIDGQMKRIPEQKYETLEGALIRYR